MAVGVAVALGFSAVADAGGALAVLVGAGGTVGVSTAVDAVATGNGRSVGGRADLDEQAATIRVIVRTSQM